MPGAVFVPRRMENAMKDRTPLFLAIVALLTLAALYINLDLFRPGYEHPAALTRLFAWQGEAEQRSLALREGLDLQGGLQVLLQADQSKAALRAGDLEAAKGIIENRVNALGVSEPDVRTQGGDKIVVELPGVANPDLAIRTIGQTALLEFVAAADRQLQPGDQVFTSYPQLFDDLPEDKRRPFLGDPDNPLGGAGSTGSVGAGSAVTGTTGLTSTAGLTGTGASASAGVTGTAGLTGTTAADTGAPTLETVFPTVITGEHVDLATVGFDQVQGIAVNFQLDSDGGRRLLNYTKDHIDQVMAIALDGEIISAPVVQAQISSEGQITGRFTKPEADALVAQITSGSLPVSLDVVGQTRIGPTLGREAVDAAIKGGIVGIIAVMIFMLLYYRMPGIVADLALILYVLFTLAVFRVLGVTLTLAGIAGFVLSVGMAVDANILIFERLKEELRAGRSLGAAMDTGFARAWPSIRDSNFSTMLTCFILIWFGGQFGASVVKGFAITLMAGVLISMFTAIVVTRSLLKLTNRIVVKRSDLAVQADDRRMRALFGY